MHKKKLLFPFQRWRPIHGFSEKALFFTDPPPFSDEKGARKLPRPREIKLPNEHWQWESEWRFESNFKGETAGGVRIIHVLVTGFENISNISLVCFDVMTSKMTKVY